MKCILYLAILLFPITISAQCPENVEFRTQVELIAFLNDYPDCELLQGNMIVREVIDLAGLHKIKRIEGNLTLNNTKSVDYSGLENLEYIGGNLFIHGRSINSLEGLNGLKEIGGNLKIQYNLIHSLMPLSNLEKIGGQLELSLLNNLESLEGLEKIYKLLGVNLFECNKLWDLQALNNLNEVEDYILLYNIGSNADHNIAAPFQGIQTLNTLIITENYKPFELLFENLLIINNKIDISWSNELENKFNELTTVLGDVTIRSTSIPKEMFPKLVSINGHLDIEDVHTFHSMQQLEFIGGDLSYKNGNRIDEPSFKNLRFVGGNLSIDKATIFDQLFGNLQFVYGNLTMERCNPFCTMNSLSFIGGHFSLYNNNFTHISGLESLAFIGGDLKINKCNNLTSIHPIQNLTYVNGNVSISSNQSLETISFLTALTQIEKNLKITGNNSLSQIDFHILTHISNDLIIDNNPQLEFIEFPSLYTIHNHLDIRRNLRLMTLFGFENLERVINITIRDNAQLNTCDIPIVCKKSKEDPVSMSIWNNFGECRTYSIVAEVCNNRLISSNEEHLLDFKIDVFPNPASDQLIISSPDLIQFQPITVSLFNMNGQLVHQQNLQCMRSCELSVHQVPSGAYHIQIFTNENLIFQQRLIVVH